MVQTQVFNRATELYRAPTGVSGRNLYQGRRGGDTSRQKEQRERGGTRSVLSRLTRVDSAGD